MDRVIAVDPGSDKCGLAVFEDGHLIRRIVISRSSAAREVGRWQTEEAVIVVGDRTGSKQFIAELRTGFGIMKSRIVSVDEHRSSEEARRRYWRENPPQGWRMLLPVSMQVPPEPVDDYVAVLLGERYLKANK